MADAAQIKVVRIQNIPRNQSAAVFHRLLSQACGSDIQVQVHLAPSCCMHDGSQVAIAKFSPRLPDFLSPLAADRVGDKEFLASVGSSVCNFDKHFFGLTQLYATVEDCDITADVVAVTGLNGRTFDSWRGVDPRGQMWLQNFFAVDLPSVRTMIYGYNTKWESKSIADVSDFVAQLSMELRKARRSRSQNALRPLIFIAHSFGAIIVARLLLEWKNNSSDAFIQSAFKSVRAVFLFGAPHRGMDINDIEVMAKEKLADHRMNLLRSLGFDSADKLALEAEKFVELADYFKIFSFYEVRLSQRLAKPATPGQAYERTGADFYFVTKKSAILGLPPPLEHQIPIDSDHSQMFVQEILTETDLNDPLKGASDTEQLNTYETPRVNQLAFYRLSQTFNDKEKAIYTSTTLEEVVLRVQDLDRKHKCSNPSRAFSRRLQPVLVNLNRYGRAFDILAKVEVMSTTVIWGLLRIIIEVAADSFMPYFDKLVSMIEKLGDSFALYRQYEELLGHDARFVVALSSFYYHMLHVLCRAKKVFLTNEFRILCRSLWRSFEMDFKTTSQALARDTSVLGDEIALAWRIKLQHRLDEQDREHQAMRKSLLGLDVAVLKRPKLMTWLMPVDMSGVFLRESQRRMHLSGQWLSEHTTVRSWLHSSRDSRLWIHGPPGSGKTVLATTMIELMRRQFEHNGQNITVFFFCNRNDEKCQSPLDILASLVSQILTELDYIPLQIYEAHNAAIRSGRSKISNSDQPLTMLKDLAALKTLNIVIDGLDECDNPLAVFQDLEELQRSVSTTRVAYLSRDTYALRSFLASYPQIKVTAVETKPDIDKFLSRTIPEIIPEDHSLRDEVQKSLSDGADGMFLWAHLMVQTLKAATSVSDIKRIMDNLPRGLEVTYGSILKEIANQSEERRDLARRILLWVCCALRPLRWHELESALTKSGDNESFASKKPFKKAVLELCGPLIEYSVEADTFRPAHLSVSEFLFRSSEAKSHDKDIAQFFIDLQQGHSEIAAVCLNCVSSPQNAFEARIDESKNSLVEYATMFWCLHLTSSHFCSKAMRDAFDFLSCQDKRRIWIGRFLFLHTAEFPLQRLLKLQKSFSQWCKNGNATINTHEATDWIQDTTQLLIDSCNAERRTEGTCTVCSAALSRISHFEKLMVVRDLSREYTMSGRLSEGEKWLTDALAHQRNMNGNCHVSTAWLLNGLGVIYDQQKRSDLAIHTQEEALSIQQNEHGPDHLETTWTVNELGRLYRHVNDFAKSEASHLRALRNLRLVLPSHDLQISWTLNTLARTYCKQGRFDEAIAMHQEAVEIQTAILGSEHPHVLWAFSDIARCHRGRGAYSEEAKLQRHVLQGREKVLGPEHPDTLWTMNNLALVLWDLGELVESKEAQQRALKGQIKLLGEEHEHTLWTKARLELFENGGSA